MVVLLSMLAAMTIVSLVLWLYLVLLRGFFWRFGPTLTAAGELPAWPPVAAIVSARNKAAVVEQFLRFLQNLDYPHRQNAILVDACSGEFRTELATPVRPTGR